MTKCAQKTVSNTITIFYKSWDLGIPDTNTTGGITRLTQYYNTSSISIITLLNIFLNTYIK